jgi:hypothetical protein
LDKIMRANKGDIVNLRRARKQRTDIGFLRATPARKNSGGAPQPLLFR